MTEPREPDDERQDHRPMADGTAGHVPSDAMEAIPTLDPRALPGVLPAPLPTDIEREPDAEQMSIARRLRQPRTIVSIAVPLAVIAIFVALNGKQLATVPGLV